MIEEYREASHNGRHLSVDEMERWGIPPGHNKLIVVGAGQLSTYRDEYRRAMLVDDPPHIWLRVPQMDFIYNEMHPLTCGALTVQLLRDIGCRNGGVSVSFDVNMGDLEIWEIRNCRMFCYGFAAEGGVELIDPVTYGEGMVIRIGDGFSCAIGSIIEGMAVHSFLSGDLGSISPPPPRLTELHSAAIGKDELAIILGGEFLVKGAEIAK